MLLGETKILAALKEAARASPADQTLLAAQRGGQTTLRFAHGRIHQSFHEEDLTVWIKVASGGRAGVATTSSLKHSALEKAIEAAMAIARLSGKATIPAFSAAPPEQPVPKLTTYFPETVHRPLEEIVREIRSLWDHSRKAGPELAGSFVAGENELVVVGSKGLVQYQPFSIGGLRLVATEGKSSGFAAQAFRDINTLDAEGLRERALNFCRKNKDPKSLRLGRYDVLLEPEAVAELLEWLGFIGFGAKQVHERTSFMTGRLGERIMGKEISIYDDGSDPRGLAVPFDLEGIPKQRVDLVTQGKAGGIVYDSQYGKLYHHPSTGHALPYDEFEGPLASNLFLRAGNTPRSEMLQRMGRGLWITRFHYVSGLLKTQEALMTGLTRDGTFLVERGKVVGAVKNLRFTQSVLEAFSNVLAVSREQHLVADPAQGFSSVVTPALLIKNFTFTGQTK
ncbi:MAG: TldD/PmbA family protein [Candidatus Omnitrophota bacterium]|nr:TldD/PmbA family protein [Candidatus Omnitrophota bacterium]